MIPCWKCGGSGFIAKFAHIENGKCFACEGKGTLDFNRASELSKEYAQKFIRTGRINHFKGIQILPYEMTTNEEFLARYKAIRKKLNLPEVDFVDPMTFIDAVMVARNSDGDKEKRELSEEKPKPKIVKPKGEGKINYSSPEEAKEQMSDEEKIKLHNDLQKLRNFTNSDLLYDAPQGLINRYEHFAQELSKRIGLSRNEYTNSYDEVDLKIALMSIAEQNLEILGDDLRRSIPKIPAPETVEEFSSEISTRYSGENFDLDNLPKDADYGSVFNVIMPDGESYEYVVDYDAENKREINSFSMRGYIPVTERKNYAGLLKNISSRFDQKHVKNMQYGLEYILNNTTEVSRFLDQNPDKISRDFYAYSDLSANLLDPNNHISTMTRDYENAKVLMKMFTVEDLHLFLRRQPLTKSSKMDIPPRDYGDSLGFMQHWYETGGGNYATTLVTNILQKEGFVNETTDHLKKYMLEVYGESSMVEYESFFNMKNNVERNTTSALLKAYLLTQLHLKSNGIDEIEVYRGLKREDASTYEPRTIESWSVNKAVARKFANNSPTGGSIMTRTVKREDILFSTDTFPLGEYAHEEEYVPIFEKGDKNFTWERGKE